MGGVISMQADSEDRKNLLQTGVGLKSQEQVEIVQLNVNLMDRHTAAQEHPRNPSDSIQSWCRC